MPKKQRMTNDGGGGRSSYSRSLEQQDKNYIDAYAKSFSRKNKPVEFGNIDLNNRPVLKNSDGSVSTVNSISFNDGKNEVLIPTIGTDSKGNAYQMSDDEAIDNYYRTGQHLGKFKTPNDANEFAQRLHNDQAKKYGR